MPSSGCPMNTSLVGDRGLEGGPVIDEDGCEVAGPAIGEMGLAG